MSSIPTIVKTECLHGILGFWGYSAPFAPNTPTQDSSDEICQHVPWIAGGNERLGKPRNNDLEHDRKDHPMLKDFPCPRPPVVLSQPNQPLHIKDHRDKQRQAKNV